MKSFFKGKQDPPAATSSPDRIERYMAHLDWLTGGAEPTFTRISAEHTTGAKLSVIHYNNLPEPGMLTAFTYGLSLAGNPAWKLAVPELCISVNSQDPSWGLAMGHVAEGLSGRCPFTYGETINLGEPISAESAMSAFLMFAPISFDFDACRVDVGDKLPIVVAGMYPIHESERQWLAENSLEAFFHLDWDAYDVTRPPVV